MKATSAAETCKKINGNVNIDSVSFKNKLHKWITLVALSRLGILVARKHVDANSSKRKTKISRPLYYPGTKYVTLTRSFFMRNDPSVSSFYYNRLKRFPQNNLIAFSENWDVVLKC